MATKNWAKDIWDDLSKIDVTQYAERKGGGGGFNPLYIPWAVVHHILMTKYAGHYDRTDHDLEILPDGTGIVSVTINIRGVEQTAKLAVMNHKFAAVVCDSRNVQDAYQRAFVKAAGLHGLGLQLWITGKGEVFEAATPKKPATTKKQATKKTPAQSKKDAPKLKERLQELQGLVDVCKEHGDVDFKFIVLAEQVVLDGGPSHRVEDAITFLEKEIGRV